ncbi:MAG: hypothetical protein ABL931_14060 [Usitatibacteraceae bacterium]
MVKYVQKMLAQHEHGILERWPIRHAASARLLFGNDLAMHRREYSEQLVLRGKWNMVLVHRELQLLNQRVEILAADIEVRVDRLHVGAFVFAGPVQDKTKLIDQLRFDAWLIGILEKSLGARVFEKIDHEVVHDPDETFLFAERFEDAGVAAEFCAFLRMSIRGEHRARKTDAEHRENRPQYLSHIDSPLNELEADLN